MRRIDPLGTDAVRWRSTAGRRLAPIAVVVALASGTTNLRVGKMGVTEGGIAAVTAVGR